MKFIWDADDIKPGRFYYRNDSARVDMGYLASVTHKIGYRADATSHDDDSGRRYVAISMTDGCVCMPHTKQEFADILNEGKYVPLRNERLIEIIAYQRNQNEGC